MINDLDDLADLEELLRRGFADGPAPHPPEDLAARAARTGARRRRRRRSGAVITTLVIAAAVGVVVSRPGGGSTNVSVGDRAAATAPPPASPVSPVSLPVCAPQQVSGCEVRSGPFAVTSLDAARAAEALRLLPAGFHTVEIGHQIISGGRGRQQGSDAAYASATGEIRVVWSHGATPPGSRTGAVLMAARDGSLAAIASVGQRFVVLTETPAPGSGALPLARGQLARDARQLVEHYEP